jgi:hypothetical protein
MARQLYNTSGKFVDPAKGSTTQDVVRSLAVSVRIKRIVHTAFPCLENCAAKDADVHNITNTLGTSRQMS